MNEMILPRRYGLVPENMGEAMKLAEMMAGAKLVPAALQKSPADCLMVIQQAIRWDMDPFAVAQECSVIQGKLMHSGKLVAAVVNARGNLTQRLSYEYDGKDDDRTITVSGQLQGEPEPRVVEVSFKNARTANTMWQKQPDQQLMYHGVRVWARRHTPELMLGVHSEEEFDDIAVQHRRPPPPAPNVIIAPAHNIDFETGEITTSPPDDTQDVTLEDAARAAAKQGEASFKAFYKSRSPQERDRLSAIGEELRELM
jgi:hypothetical protein